MPVEIQRVRNRKPRQVTGEEAIGPRALPIDDSAYPPVTHQHIARPEVAVHETSPYSLSAQAGMKSKMDLDVFSADRVFAESACQFRRDTVDHSCQVRVRR